MTLIFSSMIRKQFTDCEILQNNKNIYPTDQNILFYVSSLSTNIATWKSCKAPGKQSQKHWKRIHFVSAGNWFTCQKPWQKFDCTRLTHSNPPKPLWEFISPFPSPPFLQLYHHLDELEEVSTWESLVSVLQYLYSSSLVNLQILSGRTTSQSEDKLLSFHICAPMWLSSDQQQTRSVECGSYKKGIKREDMQSVSLFLPGWNVDMIAGSYNMIPKSSTENGVTTW